MKQFFDLVFGEVQLLNFSQITSLAFRKINENNFISVMRIQADITCPLTLPDPLPYVLDEPNSFNPRQSIFADYFSDLAKRDFNFSNTGILDSYNREITDFESVMDPFLSSQLKKQNQLLHKTLFLIYNLKNYRDPLLTSEYELAIKRLPLFAVANLQGLLDALERYGKNGTFDSFNGIYQLEQANNNLLTISETDPIRINDLFFLVKKSD